MCFVGVLKKCHKVVCVRMFTLSQHRFKCRNYSPLTWPQTVKLVYLLLARYVPNRDAQT